MNDTARRDGVQKLLFLLGEGVGEGAGGKPGRGHQLAQVVSAASATASVCLLRLLVVVRMTGCNGCVLQFIFCFFF